MRRFYCYLLSLTVFFAGFISFAHAQTTETMSLTTYYPAPYGVYVELRAQRVAIGPNYYKPATAIPAGTDLIVEEKVGIGTSTPSYKLDVAAGAISGINVTSTGTYGIASTGATAVYGSGTLRGVYGQGGGDGVYGSGTTNGVNGSGIANGVYGSGPTGVYGLGSNYGMVATTAGAPAFADVGGNGIDVNGRNSGVCAMGGQDGVYGRGTHSGVLGQGGTYGIMGTAGNYGVFGTDGTPDPGGTAGVGVMGSGSQYGVYGYSNNNMGVYGNGSWWGMYAQGGTYGLYAVGGAACVMTASGSGMGVEGNSSSNYGIYGTTISGLAAIYGYNYGPNYGVDGYGGYAGVYGSGGTMGVYGNSYYGLYGNGSYAGASCSGSSYGVIGSGGPTGVYGSGSSYGLYGSGGSYGSYDYGSYAGVYGQGGSYGGIFSGSSYAIWASGSVYVAGNLTCTGTISNSSVTTKDYVKYLSPTDYSNILKKVDDAKIVTYHWKKSMNTKEDGAHIGVLAEEAPSEIVTAKRDGINHADYMGFLFAAIKAQQTTINAQKAEIKSLKETLDKYVPFMEKLMNDRSSDAQKAGQPKAKSVNKNNQ